MPEGPSSLLVVDDEEPIRAALARYLTQQGYEVSTAATGEEALAILGRQKIAGMLLDVRMPGLSGIDLVPQALEVEPHLAILMLTAVTEATTAALCMQRGAFEYLIKTIDLVDLGRALDRALRRGRPEPVRAVPAVSVPGLSGSRRQGERLASERLVAGSSPSRGTSSSRRPSWTRRCARGAKSLGCKSSWASSWACSLAAIRFRARFSLYWIVSGAPRCLPAPGCGWTRPCRRRPAGSMRLRHPRWRSTR